jgi:hypothetical protein
VHGAVLTEALASRSVQVEVGHLFWTMADWLTSLQADGK